MRTGSSNWTTPLPTPPAGVFEALKVSDFFTQRNCTGRGYERRYRPEGTEYEMTVAIPSPLWHAKTFLNRLPEPRQVRLQTVEDEPVALAEVAARSNWRETSDGYR
jgi:hypothetical protein